MLKNLLLEVVPTNQLTKFIVKFKVVMTIIHFILFQILLKFTFIKRIDDGCVTNTINFILTRTLNCEVSMDLKF